MKKASPAQPAAQASIPSPLPGSSRVLRDYRKSRHPARFSRAAQRIARLLHPEATTTLRDAIAQENAALHAEDWLASAGITSASTAIDDLMRTQTGTSIDLPERGSPGLNPPVKAGDMIRTLCRIVGGGGWLCGPYKVIYLSGGHPAYRPKHAKVDKVASDWIPYDASLIE